MERFETFFEEDVALESVNDNINTRYWKWWEEVFMPNMKEKAEKVRYNLDHAQDSSDVQDVLDDIESGIDACDKIIKDDGKHYIRGYITYWCGSLVLNLCIGLGLLSFIINVVQRDKGDSPFDNVVKNAKKGKELLSTMKKAAEAKKKKFEAQEKKSK